MNDDCETMLSLRIVRGPSALRRVMARVWLMAFALPLALAACARSSPTSPTSQSPSSPRTSYVSTSGSDRNDGTIGAPWLTLRYAVAQLHAGDTLYMRGGTYSRQREYD